MLALSIFPASRPASIVDANELNFCVRDGNRWTLIAINTNYADGSSPSFMSKRFRALTPSSSPRFLTEAKPSMELCIMREELVTRTGFEPMLKA